MSGTQGSFPAKFLGLIQESGMDLIYEPGFAI